MSELWDEPEERFRRLVDTLWHIAEQEPMTVQSSRDHIQATVHNLGDLYKWYGEVVRPRDRELTPEDTRVSFELAQEYGYDDVEYTLNAYEGYWIPERTMSDKYRTVEQYECAECGKVWDHPSLAENCWFTDRMLDALEEAENHIKLSRSEMLDRIEQAVERGEYDYDTQKEMDELREQRNKHAEAEASFRQENADLRDELDSLKEKLDQKT